MKHYLITYPKPIKIKPIIILLGKPASGKGIQGKILIEEFGYPVLNMGKILKDKSNTFPEIKTQMENGVLIPDSQILEFITQKIKHLLDKNQPMVIDGIPRTLNQAIGLMNILSHYPHFSIYVLELQIDNNEIKNRILGRRICSNCGQSYHLINIPPLKENECDLCHAPLIMREDDTHEVIEKRIQIYEKEIEPIRKYFQEKNIYHIINTQSLTPLQIHQTIKNLIGL